MMKRNHKNDILSKQSLYIEAEADANRFNMKCLAVLCFIVLLCELFNEINIFKVPALVMRLSTILTFVLLSIPLIVYIIHDKLLRKQNKIVESEMFKHLIIVSTYVGIGMLTVTLSFHAVILLAVPPLIAAQYRNQKSLFWWIMISTILLVPIGVYGSFFLGTTDRNFIKGMMTEEEFAVLANRLTLATSSRMLELLTHYTLPRLFSAIAIVLLVSGITRRNGKMLEREMKLNQQVEEEMERITSMQTHVIDSLATLIETRDIGTGEHVIRTKRYVRMIADQLKEKEKYKDILTDEYIERIENAAPLHDIGKIAVSDTVLLKPGKLTPEEFEAIKLHTIKGGSMVQDIFADMKNDLFLHTAEEIAMYHHEKWNGTGYPKGLKGEEIPLPARIMAVADVFDALVSVRSYKSPIPPEEALEVVYSESGTHFDPEIIEVVKELHEKMVYFATVPLDKAN